MSSNRRSFGGSHVFPQNILNLTRSTQILLLQTRGTYISAPYSVRDSCTLQTSHDEWFRRSQTSVKAMFPEEREAKYEMDHPTHGPFNHVDLALG